MFWGRIFCRPRGTGDVELYAPVMRQIEHDFPILIRVLREFDLGDGTALYRIESDLLKPGYHGSVTVFVEGGKLQVRRDCDI